MDNFGQYSQGGGLDRITRGIAHQYPRESGIEAMRGMQGPSQLDGSSESRPEYFNSRPEAARDTSSSNLPLVGGAATPGSMTPRATPRLYPANYSGTTIPLEEYPIQSLHQTSYNDSPYLHSSRSYHNHGIQEAAIDPYSIADDGDDGFLPSPKRKSMLAIARQSSRDLLPNSAAGGAGTGNGIMRSLSTMVGGSKKSSGSQNSGYGPVDQPGRSGQQPTPDPVPGEEKSEWLARQKKGNNKMKWVLFGVIGGVILLAIVGGVIGGVVASKSHKSSDSSPASGSTDNADTDTATNGELGKDSAEIKALLGNTALHKVFPAIDYTPWGTQYPLCMTYPPSQNNVTRDMAVLSQLTNQVRLYGTDCNQTQMVLTAIDRLQLDDMKVWMGVWIETNETTNTRQISQMYDILESTKDLSIFSGVIVGNEALYRAGLDKASSETDLISKLKDVRSNFTSKNYDLPIATSDLGDNWNAELVDVVDLVMSNIHPFFAGVPAAQAASWTWEFWQQHDVLLTQGTTKKQVISETGWPSAGGNDCGSDTTSCPNSTAGSVAGVSEMNTYMSDWVCQALSNGTDYFWYDASRSLSILCGVKSLTGLHRFEAFDEPWKVIYNTPGKDWETEWGLMDPARNLKSGLKIPDCDGKTVKKRR